MRQITLLILFVLTFSLATTALAAKPRIRKAKVAGSGVSYSSARLSRATNSVVITFLNLNQVRSVTYSLSYVANGISQGVVGTIVPTGQTSDSRDLYFGTCSHGVCTPHYSMKNVVLLVETTLTSGGVYTKRYRIKV